jgi:hypothetical protein
VLSSALVFCLICKARKITVAIMPSAANKSAKSAAADKFITSSCQSDHRDDLEAQCPITPDLLRNPVQRGHRFQRKADSIPVIADSG